MSKAHILIVDDHLLFRRGVMASLKEIQPSWFFTEAENGKVALTILAANNDFQLVLLDVSMPVMGGLESCSKLKQLYPDLPVIMLSQFDDSALIGHFLQLGVNGYLLKDTDPFEVARAIESVLEKGKYVTAPILKAVEDSIGVTPANKVRFDLSERDREIIFFLSRGLATKEIADRMHLTETSIESYRKDLLRKTRTRNVAELISFAHRTGLLVTLSENKAE